MNASELSKLLCAHYNAPNRPIAWLLAKEIQAPQSSRRADLIAAPLTHSGGSGIIGHELKVTRADVQTELADPTKHDDWARYCDRWYLVVSDPALVDGLDIPEHWGIMAPPSGRRTRSMTILRKAPALSPVNTADAWMRLARWQTYRAHTQIAQAHTETNYARRQLEHANREINDLRRAQTAAVHPQMNRALDLIRAVEERRIDEKLWGLVDDNAIIDAVVDVTATRQAAETTRRMLDRIERDLADAFAGVADQIRRARRLGLQTQDVA
ncbi:hypothetical protein [Nocardia farcinica]|uniref:MmcB family DNA repair protein n=1 Tax=Nocardia farcinica (strain IFM 10152) TaxID=247156 RepID=Q5YSF7_NOCFA|nr:hypothetical protein [Nocardia farcinica]BAD58884.1 hypothetical protein NFA_40360 [Nocardia farcinica IFM 10152]